jgi:5'(3')-deoxyribonucleotidase
MKYHTLKDIENKVPKPGSFKHFLRIQENGGRVVKGVNTTADVGVDAIKKQAAKFGNTVDKDGRPPTLSKKVKGSKTNVLFNLGMTESVDKADESVLYYAKMAENLGELASTSKVYVDMDGVLADFFGEWQKLIGKDWRKVKDIEPALQKIRDKDNFWLDLPLLPQAKNLLGVIKKVKGSYTILSSPLPNDPNSEPHKREWIKKNLDFFPPENVIITHDKPKYAVNSDGTPNILIDDFGKNIASWEAAGGEGFKHKDHKFERTAKAIKQHMSEPVDEAFDTKINWEKDPEDHGDVDAYIAYIGYKEVGIQYFFEPINAGGVILPGLDITFEVNGATKKTGGGDASTIFGAVINHIKQFIEQHSEIDVIQFSASKEQGLSRTRLYSAMVDKLSKGTDWINAKTISKADKSVKDADMFKLVRKSAVTDKMVGIEERKLTKGEEKKKEKNVKGMKKNKGDFEKRYGKDAEAVMYATATKMAKESLLWSIETGQDLNESIDKIIQVLEEMDRRSFLNKAGKVGKLAGAAAIASSLPKFAMADNKLIVKADNGKIYDISKFPGTLQEKVKSFKEAIAKVYAKNNTAVPSFKFYLNDKFIGSIDHTGNVYKENFADGKVKGKSRPGRVKKSGASCSSSVTELRKKAKNSSGERAKMYHWCANMKSGKKK